jgi:hypothetical protein
MKMGLENFSNFAKDGDLPAISLRMGGLFAFYWKRIKFMMDSF